MLSDQLDSITDTPGGNCVLSCSDLKLPQLLQAMGTLQIPATLTKMVTRPLGVENGRTSPLQCSARY